MIHKISKGKRKGRKRRLLLLLAFGLSLFTYSMYKQNTTVGITRYDVVSDKIPKDFHLFQIVQISDLHDAEFGKDNIDLVNKIKMITPGAIFITGDFIDSNRYDLEKSLSFIEEIQFVAPIYYVTGNHEIATTEAETIKQRLAALDVIVLTDEAKMMTTFPDSKIAIGGIEDPLSSEGEDEETVEKSLKHAFKDVPDDMFKLLLSHRPEQFKLYIDEGIDLTFSGHAHGGQFRIPGMGGLIAPGQGWFPKYTSGIHEENDKRMVVSRGLGNSIIPVRLLNQPEIVVVTLKSE